MRPWRRAAARARRALDARRRDLRRIGAPPGHLRSHDRDSARPREPGVRALFACRPAPAFKYRRARFRARRDRARQPGAWPGALPGRDGLPARCIPRARPQSDRRGADDVRAGEQRALPAQDLQRRVRRGWAGAAELALLHDQEEHGSEPGWGAQRLPRQRRRHGGARGRAFLPRSRHGQLSLPRRARPHPDEGGDAQPPDRDLAAPRRVHRIGRRDPRRGRDRSRLQAKGGSGRLLRLEPALARCRPAVGSGSRKARAHRFRARHHARGTDRRGRVQQRVRPSRAVRLLPQLRAAGAGRRGSGNPRLPQADHDRRRARQHPRGPCGQAADPGRRRDRRAGRACNADRPRRRRRVQHGERRLARGSRFRLRAARQPRDAAPLPGGHRPLLGARRRQSHRQHP